MTLFITAITEWISIEPVIEWVRDMHNKYTHYRRAQNTYNELNALSDRELNDIGISRGDIRWVAEGNL
jgi:uncharacterized protein YjiS (DUF1127 family)